MNGIHNLSRQRLTSDGRMIRGESSRLSISPANRTCGKQQANRSAFWTCQRFVIFLQIVVHNRWFLSVPSCPHQIPDEGSQSAGEQIVGGRPQANFSESDCPLCARKWHGAA